MIAAVQKVTKELQDEFFQLSNYILDNPELGYREFKACRAHVDLLKKHGFQVEENYLDMRTAFRAEFDSGQPGPTVAFLAEYDALPAIGHGCGHNILGATNTGAGIVLSKFIKDLKGNVLVFGTPAEETSGAKVEMAGKGAFNGIDIALQAHPDSKYQKSGTSLAMEAIEFTYHGKTAHAATSPEDGINALDAAINTFVAINALRQHSRSDCRIHGIIAEGGKAANVVPDLAIARFYVRATTKEYLLQLVEKVKNCARGAALGAGAELEIINYEVSFDNLVSNETLSKAFTRRLKDVGVENVEEPKSGYGSTDLGNISHIAPTIHPYFNVCEIRVPGHTRDFAQATRSKKAYEEMGNTIAALVLTGIDVLTDETLHRAVWDEFVHARK